jgi:hypothetical protein
MHSGAVRDVRILQLRAKQEAKVAKLLSLHNSYGLRKIALNEGKI